MFASLLKMQSKRKINSQTLFTMRFLPGKSRKSCARQGISFPTSMQCRDKVKAIWNCYKDIINRLQRSDAGLEAVSSISEQKHCTTSP